MRDCSCQPSTRDTRITSAGVRGRAAQAALPIVRVDALATCPSVLCCPAAHALPGTICYFGDSCAAGAAFASHKDVSLACLMGVFALGVQGMASGDSNGSSRQFRCPGKQRCEGHCWSMWMLLFVFCALRSPTRQSKTCRTLGASNKGLQRQLRKQRLPCVAV